MGSALPRTVERPIGNSRVYRPKSFIRFVSFSRSACQCGFVRTPELVQNFSQVYTCARMPLKVDLLTHLEQFHTAPFLFIGSGLSRRYLGLEDWEWLLRRFASLTRRPYEYFRSSANGKFPKITTEIAKEFHDLWWDSDSYSESRNQYSTEALTNQSALKIEISKYLIEASSKPVEGSQLLEEVELLRRSTVDGIITTNWDLFLERLFPDFEVYIGQDQLLFASSQGIGELYKIHGCCSQPNSLVATEEDYERFVDRNPYLAAKLLTMFVEHPIIFLGYRINDSHISDLIQSIAQCLTTDNIDQLRDRLIFVRWDPNEPDYKWEDSNFVTLGFPIPIKTITTNSFKPIFEALTSLHRKFPARVLRRLKEHVYRLVHDNDPADQLHVMDLDQDTDPSQIKVVYGVGFKVEPEPREVRISTSPEAVAVRLSEDPNAPVLPFSLLPADADYSSLNDELTNLVRTWRRDNLAYIPKSRLAAFYSNRRELTPSKEGLRCLLASSIFHHCPFHFWAREIGREELILIVRDEISLDVGQRMRDIARLAFAIGMSDGEALLSTIAKASKHDYARKLAARLGQRLATEQTIHGVYRSPLQSTHTIAGKEVIIHVEDLNEVETIETVLSDLALRADDRSRHRVRQLDALFYGTRIFEKEFDLGNDN